MGVFDLNELRFILSVLRGVDITEVFSPDRVVEACRKHGLARVDSFELRAWYDLSDSKDPAEGASSL